MITYVLIFYYIIKTYLSTINMEEIWFMTWCFIALWPTFEALV